MVPVLFATYRIAVARSIRVRQLVQVTVIDSRAYEGEFAVAETGVETAQVPTRKAIFLVTRLGSTSRTLTVPYVIGGTASNGVDYVRLPWYVTIPAGQRSARIVIRPIDDTLAERWHGGSRIGFYETVQITLRSHADYLLGAGREATAFIIDGDPPFYIYNSSERF